MNWETIYLHLKKNGLDVYSLGQHQGKCLTPYLVLRDNGKTRRRGIEKPEYEVLMYYPADHYSEFSGYIDQVKCAMNELYPCLILKEDEQPHYLDAQVDGYMTSLIYQGTKVSKVNRI